MIFLRNDKGDLLLLDEQARLTVHLKPDADKPSIRLFPPDVHPRAHYAGIGEEVPSHNIEHAKKQLLLRNYNWAMAHMEAIDG